MLPVIRDIELAAIKLGEIMAGEDQRQAEDARRELTKRLESAESLPYSIGRRIDAILAQQTSRSAPGSSETRRIPESEAERSELSSERSEEWRVEKADLKRRNTQLSAELSKLRHELGNRPDGRKFKVAAIVLAIVVVLGFLLFVFQVLDKLRRQL